MAASGQIRAVHRASCIGSARIPTATPPRTATTAATATAAEAAATIARRDATQCRSCSAGNEGICCGVGSSHTTDATTAIAIAIAIAIAAAVAPTIGPMETATTPAATATCAAIRRGRCWCWY